MKKMLVILVAVVLCSSIAGAANLCSGIIGDTSTVGSMAQTGTQCTIGGLVFSNWTLVQANATGTPIPTITSIQIAVAVNGNGSIGVTYTPVRASDWNLLAVNEQFGFVVAYQVALGNLNPVFMNSMVTDGGMTGTTAGMSLVKVDCSSQANCATASPVGLASIGASDPGTKISAYVNAPITGGSIFINDNIQAASGTAGTINASSFGNDFIAPEPATLGLLGLGLLGIGFLARRKRA